MHSSTLYTSEGTDGLITPISSGHQLAEQIVVHGVKDFVQKSQLVVLYGPCIRRARLKQRDNATIEPHEIFSQLDAVYHLKGGSVCEGKVQARLVVEELGDPVKDVVAEIARHCRRSGCGGMRSASMNRVQWVYIECDV